VHIFDALNQNSRYKPKALRMRLDLLSLLNSIDAMRHEIQMQNTELPNLTIQPASIGCIFVGSGDSFAAGLLGQYLSGGQSLCYTPSLLLDSPRLAAGKEVYFISISGRTTANLHAAEFAKTCGLSITAITHDPKSPLAQICNNVFVLNYKDSGKATAGTLSFTASLLSCYSVATGKQLEESISQLYALASNEVSRYFDCYDAVGKSLIFV
jgi:fructoselysine-6-P-deglycase FrlB-like protein